MPLLAAGFQIAYRHGNPNCFLKAKYHNPFRKMLCWTHKHLFHSYCSSFSYHEKEVTLAPKKLKFCFDLQMLYCKSIRKATGRESLNKEKKKSDFKPFDKCSFQDEVINARSCCSVNGEGHLNITSISKLQNLRKLYIWIPVFLQLEISTSFPTNPSHNFLANNIIHPR